jgi:hypothetical protein
VPDIDPRKLERPGLLRRGEEKGQAGLFSSETVLGSTIGALSCPSGCRPFFLEGRGSFVDGAWFAGSGALGGNGREPEGDYRLVEAT